MLFETADSVASLSSDGKRKQGDDKETGINKEFWYVYMIDMCYIMH